MPGEELHDRDVTVHPVPAMHGIGGDEPVAYEFSSGGGPVRFLGYVLEIGGIRFYHSGDCLVYPELPATLVRARPRRADDPHQRPRPHARIPRDRRQHERDRSRLALRRGRARPTSSPCTTSAIAGNTGDPGHFTTLVRESGAPATVLVPPRATPVTLALP